MNYKRASSFLIVLSLLSFFFLAFLSTQESFAQDAANATVEIAVNVSELAQITVTPDYLEWIQIQPGNSGTDQTLTVENTGSTNFSCVYASVNSFALEASNPLGTGLASSYAAGSFLVLRNSTDTTMYFVNRMEWNETDELANYVPTPGAVSRGFFKNLTNEYLWDIVDDANNQCLNTSDMTFTIKTVADDGTNRDMSSNTVTGTGENNNTEWSTWVFNSGPLAPYCTAIYRDCTKIMVYRWDRNRSLPQCSAKVDLRATTFSPADSFTVTANVWVPEGIPAGNTTQSTLTITADTNCY